MPDLKELSQQLEAEALQRHEARWSPIEANLRLLGQWCYLLAETVLAAGGLHKHGGEWRRPNHGRNAEV